MPLRKLVVKCVVEFEVSGSEAECNDFYLKRIAEQRLTEVRDFIKDKRDTVTGFSFKFMREEI